MYQDGMAKTQNCFSIWTLFMQPQLHVIECRGKKEIEQVQWCAHHDQLNTEIPLPIENKVSSSIFKQNGTYLMFFFLSLDISGRNLCMTKCIVHNFGWINSKLHF